MSSDVWYMWCFATCFTSTRDIKEKDKNQSLQGFI